MGSPGAKIVDVGAKPRSHREAEARGALLLKASTIEAIRSGKVEKGDVLGAAQVAGLVAIKRTPELLPHCHPIPISGASVSLKLTEAGLEAHCVVRAEHTTGVEMDALTGCAIALLTAWDMVKSLEKDGRGQYPTTSIQDLRIVRKEKRELGEGPRRAPRRVISGREGTPAPPRTAEAGDSP